MAMLVALARGEGGADFCKDAVKKGIVGRSCAATDVVAVNGRRSLNTLKTPAFCTVKGKCTTDAFYVTLGNGCYWERQYAYTHVEMAAPFNRKRMEVTSRVGYIGGHHAAANGQVCYHGPDKTFLDYEKLGFYETVQVKIDNKDKVKQFTALVKDFFGSFLWDSARIGMRRPDDWSVYSGDHGLAYRSGLSFPGGMRGPLYKIVDAENKKLAHPMNLVAGKGNDPDVFNTVYIMDSDQWPFYIGEAYHQFHSNFFGKTYETAYTDMNKNYIKAHLVEKSTVCRECQCHYRRRSLRTDNMRAFVAAMQA